MSKPMFSIIIPIYNTEKELERCVYSVSNQTFRDLELILVDDGSKDNSGAICDSLAEEDDRIIVIHQQNAGSSEARNAGIRASHGEYLIFVDSDDLWDDRRGLEGIAKTISEHPDVDVVCFGVRIFNEKGAFVKERKPTLPVETGTEKVDVIRHLVYSNGFFSASYVKALRREFIINQDLFFVKGLLSEDIEWSARILVGCRNIAIYPNTFYKRIQRKEGSLTSSIGKNNITDILGSIEKGVCFAKEKAENTTFRALYYEYWAYQYAMLLGLAYKIRKDEEYPIVLQRLKKLKWLLKYDHVNKVAAVRRLTTLLGVSNTIRVLSIYYHVK